VDELCATLRERDHQALPYHAGLPPEERQTTQDAFLNERCDLVVATVAFGMGIDRSNIRFVLHAGMPKSVEHYQQEAGRAGRDGLPAECVLLYSAGDFMTWKKIIELSAREAGLGPDFIQVSTAHLEGMNRYCRGVLCRHRALLEYFGQSPATEKCGACDVCLGEVHTVADSTVIAQKILSCVARVREGYGVNHVMSVLLGETNERIERLGHNKLSTFGLFRNTTKRQLRDWIRQLIGQKLLDQVGTEYPILKLNAASWEVMRSKRPVELAELARRTKRDRQERPAPLWDGIDGELFEALRRLRMQVAREMQMPPYIVFTDNTLREMVRVKPKSREELLTITGVGQAKWQAFGERFLALIRSS
jgi:ATP-dependent DNA helicase RecQ